MEKKINVLKTTNSNNGIQKTNFGKINHSLISNDIIIRRMSLYATFMKLCVIKFVNREIILSRLRE